MSSDKVKWEKVEGYDDYMISEDGRVRNIKRGWILTEKLGRRWLKSHNIKVESRKPTDKIKSVGLRYLSV